MEKPEKKTIVSNIFIILGVLAIFAVVVPRYFSDTYDTTDSEYSFSEQNDEISIDNCSVVGINIHGEITTYIPQVLEHDFVSSEAITSTLDSVIEKKKSSDEIKAVILEIDSYGGEPVAAYEIATKIKQLDIPVIAYIRGAGASAGYWIASSADRIFANKISTVGSIGVTMSYLDESKLNLKEGYTWNQLSTGKFKDSGSPEKPLTKEERTLFERDMKKVFDLFVDTVSTNRNIPRDEVLALADGSTMLGDMALEHKLIDEIGGLSEVTDYLKTTYNIEPDICWD